MGFGANYQIVSGQTGAPVSCINCGSNLGSKFVRKSSYNLKNLLPILMFFGTDLLLQVSLSIETSAIKAGRFMIDMQVHCPLPSPLMNLRGRLSCL